MKLKIHLRHGLLHMLDKGGRGVQQAFALAQIGPQFYNLAFRTKAGAQQAIRVKPLQPLRIAHVRLATGTCLASRALTRITSKPRSSSNSKIGIQ